MSREKKQAERKKEFQILLIKKGLTLRKFCAKNDLKYNDVWFMLNKATAGALDKYEEIKTLLENEKI